MLRPGLLGLGLIVLCVACAPREPKVYQVERGRTYAEDRAVVWQRVQSFLEANGITVTRADAATGVIDAERSDYQDAGWAECERAWVSDQTISSPAPTRASPISRDLALEVAVRASASGTEVQPRARFTEQQLDPYRNWPFTQPCRSTGVLETALLNALGATPPATGHAAGMTGSDQRIHTSSVPRVGQETKAPAPIFARDRTANECRRAVGSGPRPRTRGAGTSGLAAATAGVLTSGQEPEPAPCRPPSRSPS